VKNLLKGQKDLGIGSQESSAESRMIPERDLETFEAAMNPLIAERVSSARSADDSHRPRFVLMPDYRAQTTKIVRNFHYDQRGSVIPLILAYFLVTLITIFIGINVTHTSLERRHLTLALEASLQRAVQTIDDASYYTGYVDQNTTRFRARGITTFVPIDCASARRTFDEEFSVQWALTKALNPAETLKSPRMPLQLGFSDPARVSQLGIGSERLISTPRLLAFDCDGRVVSATVELLVELPFRIAFAGVEFAKYVRQVVTVDMGLILGDD